jgi:hypothetical protein
MSRHPSSAYLSPPTLSRGGQLFRTATPNPVGWAAVAGLCGAGAATGWVTARLTGMSSWIAVTAGGAAAFAALVAADRRKWAGMPTDYCWTHDVAEAQRIAELLGHAGIAASVEIDEFDQPGLRYLNRDRRRIARAFRSAGLPPPPKS